MGQSADPKHPRPRHYDEDLKLFLERFRDEALFDYIPGREHSEFHDFEESSNRLKSPVKFARHVAALRKEMGFWRQRGNDARPPTNVKTI